MSNRSAKISLHRRRRTGVAVAIAAAMVLGASAPAPFGAPAHAQALSERDWKVDIGFLEIDKDITLRRMVVHNANPKGTILFLHGFPETLYAWKDIALRLMFLQRLSGATMFLLIATSGLEAADPKELVVGIEVPNPPWVNTKGDGNLEGFDIDFSEQICNRIAVRCSFANLSFDELIPSLVRNRIDVIISALEPTDRREQIIAFGRAYAQDKFAFVVESGSPLGNLDGAGNHTDLAEPGAQPIIQGWQTKLKGKTLAIQRSTRGMEFAQKFLGQTNVVEFNEATDVLQALVDKAADVSLLTERAATDGIRRPSFSNMRIVGAVARGSVLGRGVAVGFRKSDAELRRLFDQEISKALNDGTLLAMSKKWFSTNLTPQ